MARLELSDIRDQRIRELTEANPAFDILSFDFFDADARRRLEIPNTWLAGDSSAAIESEISSFLLNGQRLQRLLRISPDTSIAQRLADIGLDSAIKIASMSPSRFVAETKSIFGSDEEGAIEFHAKAGHIKTAVQHLYGTIKDVVASPLYRSAKFNGMDPRVKAYFSQIPSYTELFGNMDYLEFDPRQTIFSPAAYFFDLMRIVDEYITHPNVQPIRTIPDGYTLEERRPDLFALKLTPANSFDEIAYLALVNRVLCASIEARPVDNAYQYLAVASYPFNLPFNLPLFQLRTALSHMNCSLATIYDAMEAPGNPNGVRTLDVARERIGLSLTELADWTRVDDDEDAVTRKYGYDIPRSPSPSNGSGIVGQLAGSSALTGLGTRFISQVSVGDRISIGAERRTVTGVADETHLTIDVPWTTTTALEYTVAPKTFLGQGTIGAAPAGTTVTGTGTAFRTQLVAGAKITAAKTTRTVLAVASDSSLTVDTPWPTNLTGLPYAISPPSYKGSGGIIFSRSSVEVVGVGTSFTEDFADGAQIGIGDTLVSIASVSSATKLNVAAVWESDAGADYEIRPRAQPHNISEMLPTNGAGTITFSKDSARLVGSGTAFKRQLREGDQILAAGVIRTIKQILSDTEATMNYNFDANGTDVGFTILKFDGVDLIDVFLARTDLSQDDLHELLRQNLDDREIAAGAANRFFINDSGETPAILTSYISNDPGNPTRRLSGLTLKRLDRISRFVRLARALSWTFIDLQWAMTATGVTEITEDLALNVARIAHLSNVLGYKVIDVIAIFHQLKLSGRVDAHQPKDQFDVIYNSQATFKDADPDLHSSTIPFDPDREQAWTIEETGGANGIIRVRLRSALHINDAELTRLAKYVQCITAKPAPTSTDLLLTLDNFSWLYRLSSIPAQLSWTIDQYLTFIGLLCYQNASDYFAPSSCPTIFALDALADQFELANWINSNDFSVSELQYIVTGRAGLGYQPPYNSAVIRDLIADFAAAGPSPCLATRDLKALPVSDAHTDVLFDRLVRRKIISSSGILLRDSIASDDVAGLLPIRVTGSGDHTTVVTGFDDLSFVTDGILEADSKLIFTGLLEKQILIVQPSGTSVAQTFSATTDLDFLSSIFPNDAASQISVVREILSSARRGSDELRDLLDKTIKSQKTNLPRVLSDLSRALADMLDSTPAAVNALLPFSASFAKFPNYLDAFFNPSKPGDPLPPGLLNFLSILARITLITTKFELSPSEIAFLTSTPDSGSLHFNIGSWSTLTLDDVRSISSYVTLRNSVGAHTDELVAYFLIPSTDQALKTASLVAATGWDGADIDLLVRYFWPKADPRGSDTVIGLCRLAKVLDIAHRLGVRVPTIMSLISISHMPIQTSRGTIDAAGWLAYQETAQIGLGIVNAAYSGTAAHDVSKSINDSINAAARDALAHNVLWWMSSRDSAIRNKSDLYRYLLLDVEVSPCFVTSPIVQAISSLQLYMQRARMMLEAGVERIALPKAWWAWMMNYRVWEANRRIFVYPENYIQPSLRQGATPEFAEFADDLLQNDPSKTNVVKPFEKFTKALTVLGSLMPVGSCQGRRQDQRTGRESNSIFLIGRTRTQPYQYYFRTLDSGLGWSPWHAIDVTISADRLSCVYAFGRLFAFWVEFDVSKSSSLVSSNLTDETVDKATIKFAFHNDGEWSSTQTLQESALINTYPYDLSDIIPDSTNRTAISQSLERENSYWQFPFVVSTGGGTIGTDRVSITKGTTHVDGTLRTRFKREIQIGDIICCFGEQREVTSIASDFLLTVKDPWSNSARAGEYKVISRSNSKRFRPFTGTGKVRVEADRQTVTGTDTRFSDEFVYGDSIQVGNDVNMIVAIIDHTNLTVVEKWKTDAGPTEYNVIRGRQDDENILVCFGPAAGTSATPLVQGTPPTDDSNPGKKSFISQKNQLRQSVYGSLYLAHQFGPSFINFPGYVPLSNCIFLDANLSRAESKAIFANYDHAGAENPQPFYPTLLRSFGRLSVESSSNLLWQNYWGANLPGQRDSRRSSSGNNSVDLLFNIVQPSAALIMVGNNPGAFIFDNVDEAFLVLPDSDSNLLSDIILRSSRPFVRLENTQIISTSAYTTNEKALPDISFKFHRLTTSVMPTLQQRLFAGGVERLLQIGSQYLSELPFNRFYPPQRDDPPPRVIPDKSSIMDFDGAFGLYFWEVFFHTPFLIADRLQGNNKFEDALTWLAYIFNPLQQRDEDDEHSADKRFWRFRPFREMDQPSLLANLTNGQQIERYNYDPFNPDAIAAIRHVAYAKTAVMRYIDIVLDWGDALFTQYTRESITQATNLYTLAEDLLGKKPRSQGKMPLPEPKSFGEIRINYPNEIPQFLVDLENTPYLAPREDNERYASQPINDIIAYFAVPENTGFMKYWDRVEDRLFKIRNCMNIDGQVVPLALYEPPIDPMLLIQAAAAGGGSALSALTGEAVPNYRFGYLAERAKALCGQLASLDSALLGALEKKDAEALSMLMAQQEALVIKLTTVAKKKEIAEVENSDLILKQSLLSTQARKSHYENLIKQGLSPREQSSLDSMLEALGYQLRGSVTRTAASIGYAVPQVGSPFAMTYGGQQIGNALNAASGVFEIGAAISHFVMQQTQTLASYDRRAEDWELQKLLAGYEIDQIEGQIRSNSIRLEIARQTLAIHEEQIRQNQDRITYFKEKYTNAKLYQWLVNQISRYQFQTYTLAYRVAQLAQRAYQYEYSTDRAFINFDYWDNAHKGLSSSEGLLLALNQMEASILDSSRPLEITKFVSLRGTSPVELIKLKETGECFVELSEKIFDLDFPGHFNRQIKSVSVSIPCVLGPYENMKGTLTQIGNHVVVASNDAGLNAIKFLLDPQSSEPSADAIRTNWRNFQQIVLSRGQDETGLFAASPDNNQYLPFEGTGAVSSWHLTLPKETNRISYDSISDVVITLNYTARDGGEAFRRKVKGLAALKQFTGVHYVNCKSMYFESWHKLFSSYDAASKTQTLLLPIDKFLPSNLTKGKLLSAYIRLSADTQADGRYVTLNIADTWISEVQLSKDNSATCTFEEKPDIDKITSKPIKIVFDLTKTPAPLKKNGTELDPATLKDIDIVFSYTATARP